MPTKRECVAYHEAGHAVAAHHFSITIGRVTIVPSHTYSGCLKHSGIFCDLRPDEELIERAIQFCLAGPLSERGSIAGAIVAGADA